MNIKVSYIAFGAVLVGIVVWGIIIRPWSTPEMPLEDGSGGTVMKQIDPPTLILQAGSDPIGANESRTGFKNENGVKMYNGQPVQQDSDEIQFEMEVEEESDVKVVSPKLELVDENGNPMSEEEKKKALDDIYRE